VSDDLIKNYINHKDTEIVSKLIPNDILERIQIGYKEYLKITYEKKILDNDNGNDGDNSDSENNNSENNDDGDISDYNSDSENNNSENNNSDNNSENYNSDNNDY